MTQGIPSFAVALCLAAAPLAAQEIGTAAGKGTIEQVSLSPRYSYAHSEGTGATS
jgi:hypothetical protein